MYLTVYITTKNKNEAKRIAKILLKERLIACSNIVPCIESFYWWKGKIVKDSEALLIGKTRNGLEDKILKAVKKHHSYTVPCVNFLPIAKGNPDYFKWLESETRKK
jgi:periplasmic divalent cation tolerance protein